MYINLLSVQFSSVAQSCPTLVTPWTTACQASLSITNSWSPNKPMSIELLMPSNHLILCCPLLLLSSIFPSIRVFSRESALRIRWPKYRNFSFNINPSNEHPGLIPLRMDWLDVLAAQGALKSHLYLYLTLHMYFFSFPLNIFLSFIFIPLFSSWHLDLVLFPSLCFRWFWYTYIEQNHLEKKNIYIYIYSHQVNQSIVLYFAGVFWFLLWVHMCMCIISHSF